MWYILLAVMILSCVIMGTVIGPVEEKEKDPKKKKRLENIAIGFTLLAVGCLLVFILYGIGWVWYFLGGFLVVECSNGFWEYVFNGLISLIPLFGILGLIMIVFGWDPDRR